ncbi:hypothetical protein UFOVP447_196 [uncultured Caudovirales phage]|uniref:Uncharacterized protein n=1 Tax=uncultured Caudovirales phage TaxID=2100421 RepID=A0A6J5M9H2_9CAUD|nr:hypothetical protein UFOVP447_196 [uncultured Caudovirales phage]
MDMLKQDFMKRAAKITSFNLMPSDFTSTRYKKEIQTLYSTHMFPSFNPSKALSTITLDGYNRLVNELKSDDKEQYEKLHNLALKGVGPGEAVLFLLTKNGYLGGGSSAGVDLFDGGTKYEVKAVQVNQTGNYAYNFRLGGTVPLSDIILQFYELAQKHKQPASKSEIKKSTLEFLEKKDPAAFKKINDQYAKLAYDYFKNHKTIFIHNKGPRMGLIEAIKFVRMEDIKAEVVTAGTIKPMVYL